VNRIIYPSEQTERKKKQKERGMLLFTADSLHLFTHSFCYFMTLCQLPELSGIEGESARIQNERLREM
jgi:hypothetical protein